MKSFAGKLAIVTGAGTGMGRELAIQLIKEGCHVAACDVLLDNLAETEKACRKIAPPDTLFTAHECDVSEEAQVIAFRDAIKKQHKTEQINLLFNNAGVGGSGSFVNDDRGVWDKTFGVCWFGVYYCTRAFMPMLLASSEAHIINTSSVNGFWACLGHLTPHTAYSSAKFAVKGFTEALQIDLRINAPHVKASLVMPGHIGTSIAINSSRVHGGPGPAEMSADDLEKFRGRMARVGTPVDGIDDDTLRVMIQQRMEDFRDNAPMSAAQAATVILDGVRDQEWRILVGEDAKVLDRLVREHPLEAYEPAFMEQMQAEGHFEEIAAQNDPALKDQ